MRPPSHLTKFESSKKDIAVFYDNEPYAGKRKGPVIRIGPITDRTTDAPLLSKKVNQLPVDKEIKHDLYHFFEFFVEDLKFDLPQIIEIEWADEKVPVEQQRGVERLPPTLRTYWVQTEFGRESRCVLLRVKYPILEWILPEPEEGSQFFKIDWSKFEKAFTFPDPLLFSSFFSKIPFLEHSDLILVLTYKSPPDKSKVGEYFFEQVRRHEESIHSPSGSQIMVEKAGCKWQKTKWPGLSPPNRQLLFIHGIMSSITGGFQDTPKGKVAQNAFSDFCIGFAFPKYGQVLGYDHSTLTKSPEQNAEDLYANLSHPVPPLDIIAHSRGGLVARCLVERVLPEKEPHRNQMDRLIMVGTPNLGTDLATPENLKEAIDLFTNLVYHFLEFRLAVLVKLIGWVVKVLAENVVDILPGVTAMNPDDQNSTVNRLKLGAYKKNIEYDAIRASFSPYLLKIPSSASEVLLRLLSVGVFKGAHDLVVNFERTIPELSSAPPGYCETHTSRRGTHHLTYFSPTNWESSTETYGLIQTFLEAQV